MAQNKIRISVIFTSYTILNKYAFNKIISSEIYMYLRNLMFFNHSYSQFVGMKKAPQRKLKRAWNVGPDIQKRLFTPEILRIALLNLFAVC